MVNDVSEDIFVLADKESILGVVMNLVGNAVKFTPEGGHVRITAVDCGNRVDLCVEDDGLGVDEEKISKLLYENLYFTTPGTNGEPGTGLGLMLCESQLVRNGSHLHFRRNESSGSTFGFELEKYQA